MMGFVVGGCRTVVTGTTTTTAGIHATLVITTTVRSRRSIIPIWMMVVHFCYEIQ